LIEAGILDWREGEMRVLPPHGANIEAEVRRRRAGMAQHWSEDGRHPKEEASALREALAGLGARNAARIAEAIAQQGSSAYTTPSGAVLELLSDFAREGELEAVAYAYQLFAEVRPANADFVRASLPPKIASGYLASHLRLRSVGRLDELRPSWASDLRDQVVDVRGFAALVGELVATLEGAAEERRMA